MTTITNLHTQIDNAKAEMAQKVVLQAQTVPVPVPCHPTRSHLANDYPCPIFP